jgi:hypothetical protein
MTCVVQQPVEDRGGDDEIPNTAPHSPTERLEVTGSSSGRVPGFGGYAAAVSAFAAVRRRLAGAP